MLEDYAKIQPEVQKEIKTQLERFFSAKQKEQQFQLSKIQNHIHNGVDAQKIPPSSILTFIPMASTIVGSAFSYAQSIGQGVDSNQNTGAPGIYPIPLITGGGGSPTDAFNGGEAPNGTLIAFHNTDLLTTELWVKVDSFWYGVVLPLTAPAAV